MPLTTSTLRDFASDICQAPVGTSWAKRFIARHPELKIRWTTGLEKCRAQSLNRTVVNEFFELIRDLIEMHNISPENIYNMDEKGVQLGIGKRIAAHHRNRLCRRHKPPPLCNIPGPSHET